VNRFIERMLENDLDTANDHLPSKKASLAELLREEKPSYLTRSGEKSLFLIDEVKRVAEETPVEYHDSFMLPIVILRRMDLGIGIYTIAGSKIELFFIHRNLNPSELSWSLLKGWRPIDRIARPQVQIVRRKLPSTTCLGFTTSTGFDEDQRQL